MLDELHDLSRFYRALGDETRLRLVELLAYRVPGKALCAGPLAQELAPTSSTVWQHLRVLKDLGLVRGERRGFLIHYYLNEERLHTHQDSAPERPEDGFAAPRQDAAIDEEVRSTCCCDPKSHCAHPGKLKEDPSECTLQQIQECHSEAAEHTCECKRSRSNAATHRRTEQDNWIRPVPGLKRSNPN